MLKKNIMKKNSFKKTNYIKHLLVLFVFLVLSIIFFWPFIKGDAGFVWDTKVFGFGNLHMVTKFLSKGEFLLWNPFNFSGYPFAGNIEVGLFYPINWAWAFLFGGITFEKLSLYFVLHYWIGAFFAYLLCFKLTKNTLASFIGGIVYAYSGYALGHISHMGQDIMYMWVPIVFLAFIIALEKHKWFYTLLAGASFGFAILIGHYNTSVYVLLGLFVFTIYKLANKNQTNKERKKIAVHSLTATIFALFVSAILVFPVAQLAFQSNRSQLIYEQQSEGWSLNVKDLIGFVNPNHNHVLDENPLDNFNGSVDITQDYFYIGLIPLLFILIALFSKWKYKWFFITFGTLCLFAAFGKYTPVNYILFKVFPGFSKARMAVQIMGMVYLSAAVMSAIGAKFLFTKKFNIKNSKIPLQIFFLVLSFLVVSDIFSHGYNKRFYSELNPQGQSQETAKVVEEIKSAQNTDLFRISDEKDFLRDKYSWESYDIESIWGTSGIRIKKYDNLFKRLDQTNWQPINNNLYDFLNVKYVITTRSLPSEDFEKKENSVYINTQFLPRAYFVKNYKVVEDEEALNIITNGEIDFANEVLLNKEPTYLGEYEENSNLNNIEIVEKTPSYLKIKTALNEQSILVTSEVDYNGWNLYVDGKKQNYLTANYTFRAVALNPGEHIVEFKYQPTSIYIGAFVSFLSICLLIFTGIKKNAIIPLGLIK